MAPVGQTRSASNANFGFLLRVRRGTIYFGQKNCGGGGVRTRVEAQPYARYVGLQVYIPPGVRTNNVQVMHDQNNNVFSLARDFRTALPEQS